MTIEGAKILIIGSGGIGCELLKNAVLSNFKAIEIVDLDTIELSNLNRQFLFRRKHIGMSKAEVAREAALKMNPQASIIAHFANIMDTTKFSISFFEGFDLVLNALDNLTARKYVNTLCLMAKVPLIESGTAGYLGQTSIIIGRKTECFECIPKEPPKTFPVCTIRSTPSTPIHCIIWSKEYLLPNAFGDSKVAIESFQTEQDETDELKATWNSEQTAFSSLKYFRNDPETFYQRLCENLFVNDIEKICKIEDLWKGRSTPKAFDISAFNVDAFTESELTELNDQIIWPIIDWIRLLKSSIFRLLDSANSGIEIVFDKDDACTLDFVAASANLRASVFGIDLKSRFDIKAMAGSIIPAIASTNAIAAAMIIVHANNILNNNSTNFCNAYINYGSKSARSAFSIEQPCPPNPDCHICSTDRALIHINVKTVSIKNFLDVVIPKYMKELKAKFGEIEDFDDEDLCVFEGSRLLYDVFDDNGNREKTMASLGISDSKLIKIEFGPRRSLLIGILHTEEEEEVAIEPRIFFDCIAPKTLKATTAESSEDELLCFDASDDIVEIVESSNKKAKIAQDEQINK